MNATGWDGFSAAWKIVGLTESIWIANPMFSAWFAPARVDPDDLPRHVQRAVLRSSRG